MVLSITGGVVSWPSSKIAFSSIETCYCPFVEGHARISSQSSSRHLLPAPSGFLLATEDCHVPESVPCSAAGIRPAQDSFDSRSGSQSLYRGLLPARTYARGLGLLRFVSASRKRFRSTLSDQANDASPDHRRREVARRSARATDEAGCYKCDGCGAQKLRTLGDGGAAKRDHRRLGEVPVTVRK